MTDKQIARFEHRMNILDRRRERRQNRINEKIMKKEHNPYPRFVNFQGTILIKRGQSEYWCYNGEWGITAWLDTFNGIPILKSRRSEHFKHNVVLSEATEEEWVNCVGIYRPSSVALVDGQVSFGEYIPNKVPTKWPNPCMGIPLGEPQECLLRYQDEIENKYRYLLIC